MPHPDTAGRRPAAALAPRALYAAALLLTPGLALADQYAYLDLQQATAAVAALDRPPHLAQSFCAPCGDAQAQPLPVRQLGIERIWDRGDTGAQVYVDGAGTSYWQVSVDGRGIDLAYVYVQRDGVWRNLAIELGLEPSDVPDPLPAERIAE